MADPLSISTGQGRGEAQILPSSGKSPYDLYSDYIGVKKQKQAVTDKNVGDTYKMLDDIKLGGFVKDTQYLYDKKNKLQQRIASQLLATKGKYNYATDEEVIKELNSLKEMNTFSENIKGWYPAEIARIEAEKDSVDPESAKELLRFSNLPIEERYEYVRTKGLPVIKRKAKTVDYISGINKLDTPMIESGGETGSKDGRIGTYDTKVVDEAKLDVMADRWWTAGEKGVEEPQALMIAVKEKVDSDPNAVLWTDEEKAQKTKQAFKDEFKKIKISQASTSAKYGSKSDGDGGFSFGGDGSLETDNYVYVVGDEKRTTKKTEKQDEGKSTYDPSAYEKEYTVKTITPTPKRGGINKVDEFVDTDGDRVVMRPEKAEQKENGEWVIIGTTAGAYPREKEVPYKGNEGTWRGNFDGSPDQIYDETAKRRGKKSTGKGGSTGASSIAPKAEKTASMADARKANPGVSDSELIKRYAKLGYKIK